MLRIVDGFSSQLCPPGCRIALIPAIFACLIVVFSCSASPRASQGSDQIQDPPLTLQEKDRLHADSALLLNDADTISPEIRIVAARNLLTLGKPQAIAILDEALRSGSPPTMSAALQALREANSPPSSLLEALLLAAVNPPDETMTPLGSVLSKYGKNALERVGRLALDPQAPVEQRLAPIHLLGAFAARDSVQRLMMLLSPDRQEPEAILQAACAGLEQATGMPFGNDPESWRTWWLTARDLPQSKWLKAQVTALMELVTRLQEEIQRERQTHQKIAEQFTAIYRDLFPSLPLEEQLKRLPDMLDNSLLPVREFAIDRIARLLRDSRPIPDDVQQKLAARLDDPHPELRRESMRLLDELAWPGLSEQIVARLEQETDEETIRRIFIILAKRPTLSALPGILHHASDPPFTDEAAAAVWSIANLPAFPPGDSPERQSIRETYTPIWDHTPQPSILRILARFGSSETITPLLPLLDGEDAALRDALAEGLVNQPLIDPLLKRAANPSLYLFAVQGLVTAEATQENLQRLGDLTPPPPEDPDSPNPLTQIWEEGLVNLATKLPHESIIATDDLLKTVATSNIRRKVLETAWALPPESFLPETRLTLARHLAQLLLQMRLPAAAHTLLAPLEDESLKPLRFKVALSSGEHFDEALGLNPNPKAWITILESLATDDPPRAITLSAEINRRFGSQMDDPTRALYQAATDRIPPPRPDSPNPASPAPPVNPDNPSG